MKPKRTQHLRVKLSIPQNDFANFLNIKRSRLSMYELKKRDLPVAAIEKLAILERLHDDMQQGKLTMANKTQHRAVRDQQQKIKAEVRRLLEKSQYKKKMLEKQLSIMRNTYERTALWAQLVEHMIAQPWDYPLQKGDLLWLELQQERLAKNEIRYGRAVQALAEAQIEVLKTQIQQYKKLVRSIG